jgi:hypothetical protein
MAMLYDRGYGEQDILELHHFLDWLMRLPKELEQQFQAEFKAFEEADEVCHVDRAHGKGTAEAGDRS